MRWLIGAALASILAGPCVAETLKVVVPEPVSVQPLPAGAPVQAVTLTRVGANIAPGTAWIENTQSPYFFVPCVSTGEVVRWREDDNKVANIESFQRIYSKELGAVGFKSGGDATNLFEERTASDLQVGALITGLQARACTYVSLTESFSGASTMDVDWQIFSVTKSRVVARIKTHGGFTLKPSKDGNRGQLITEAFADNVRRLLADEGFRSLVTTTPTAVATPAAQPSAVRMPLPAPTKPMPLSIAAKGVVSVFAGEGWGSGVLISPQGYVLTNHHVTGDSGRVRVHWPDGTDTVGEIIRTDKRRDVALIKTTPPRVEALAVRSATVELGETVYAIGTPKEKEFAGTLTRGVVSTVDRQIEGQRFIQSDVAMTFGNSGGPLLDQNGWIVGLSDLTYAPNGVSQNINFFIPIDEALKALAVTPG